MSMMDLGNRDGAIQSVSRSFATLRGLNLQNGSSVQSLARSIGLPRATVYRILETLVNEGYVRKDQHTGGYWLQERVRELGVGYSEQRWILDDASEIIDDLYARVRWCLTLTVPQGDEMVIRVATLKRNLQGGQRTIAGRTMPIATTGPGLIYLAFCRAEQRRTLLDVIQSGPRDGTRAGEELDTRSWSNLIDNLDAIRGTGYHIHRTLTRERSLTVPVFRDCAVEAALSMTYFASSMPMTDLKQFYLPQLQDAARRLGATQTELA